MTTPIVSPALPSLVLFRSCFGPNRIPEFESITYNLYPNVEIEWQWDRVNRAYYGGDHGPSVIQRLPDDLTVSEWAEVAMRCIGCKDVFQVLGEGETLNDCIQQVGRLSDEQILDLIQGSWSMQVKMPGRSDRLHPKERRERVESFRDVLAVLSQRKVVLKNPDHELVLLEDCRSLESDPHAGQPQPPHHVYLLLKVSSPTSPTVTDLAELSDVKKRAFISTTTMPADRALLMSNLGLIGTGMTMLDPFCGSGGLLLSSALLGARVVGADVDAEILSFTNAPLRFPNSPLRPNRGVEVVSYGDSFTELGLNQPTLLPGLDIQSDDFVNQVLQANHGQRYDAIVTDPPYGIRESSSKMDDAKITERLCAVASQVLKPFGRVVFLRVVECTLETLQQTQHDLEQDLKQVATQYSFDVSSVGFEKFNNRLWRATIVITLMD